MILKIINSQKWQKTKWRSPNFYIWFSVCNQKYKKMIEILYFIYGFIARFG
jgi:hypothetical protein